MRGLIIPCMVLICILLKKRIIITLENICQSHQQCNGRIAAAPLNLTERTAAASHTCQLQLYYDIYVPHMFLLTKTSYVGSHNGDIALHNFLCSFHAYSLFQLFILKFLKWTQI